MLRLCSGKCERTRLSAGIRTVRLRREKIQTGKGKTIIGLDIWFRKHKDSNKRIENAFRGFWEEFNEDMPVEQAKELAEDYGISFKLDIEEKSFKEDDGKIVTFTTAYRNDEEEVMYFRKENWLLPFFGYEDDCSDIVIDKYDVMRFIETAEKVLESRDPETADELLSVREGFFFGTDEYDDDYFNDVEGELEAFRECLEEMD